MLVAANTGTTEGYTALLKVSFRVMVTVEVAVPLAVMGLLPVMLEFPTTAAPPVKLTTPPVTAGEVKKRVLVSATVDFKVQVETPKTPDEQVP